MSLYVPILQKKYTMQGLYDQKKWSELIAAGILTASAIEDTWEEISDRPWKPGDLIYLPAIVQAAPFVAINLNSTGAQTFSQMSSNDSAVPIIRAVSANQFKRYDVLRTGEGLRAMLDATVPNQASQMFLTIIGEVLSAALIATETYTYPAVNTTVGPAYSPDAGQIYSHVLDITGGTAANGVMTVQTINQMRALMGDIGLDALHTLVAPMNVLLDLYFDLTTNYKYNAPMAQFLIDGGLRNIIGVQNIIPSDFMPRVAGRFNSLGIDTYSSFLVGDDALHFFYARELDIEEFENTPQVVTQMLVKYNLDFALAPRYFKYTGPISSTGGTSGPTFGTPAVGGGGSTDLSTPGNWTVETEDHRNIHAVMLNSYGFGGRTPRP